MLQAYGILTTTAFALAVWEGQGDNVAKGPDKPKATRVSVRALANVTDPVPFVRESERSPVKPAIKQIANSGSPAERRGDERERLGQKDLNRLGQRDLKRPERDRAVMQRADVRGNAANDLPRRKLPGVPNDQFVPAGNRAFDRDFSPLTGEWGGFGPGGFFWGRITGYRSFTYPLATFAPYDFANGYFVPGYYGFGFPPVAFGISGPVTIHYDDPQYRQWKMVQDGIRNFAADNPANPANPRYNR